MVGKKNSILLAVCLTATLFGGCAKSQETSLKNNTKENSIVKIGISQIAEHPALDSSRKGFIEALKSKGFEDGKNIKIDFQNAQGDIATAQTIAQNFVSEKKDLIFAIATPSAQAAYNATKDISIVITAVTDPVSAGLVKTLDSSGTNVTGTSDKVPLEEQMDLLKRLVPNCKRVGVLYNTGESNSEIQINNMKKVLPSLNLELEAAGVTNVNEIPQALSSMLDKVDVLYVPTDNLVVSAISLITSKCLDKNIPVIGAERAHVEAGALATIGIDYYQLGFQTGLAAVEILNGKKPTDIPITLQKDMKLVVNTDAAKKLNLTIPEDIMNKSEKITRGVK